MSLSDFLVSLFCTAPEFRHVLMESTLEASQISTKLLWFFYSPATAPAGTKAPTRSALVIEKCSQFKSSNKTPALLLEAFPSPKSSSSSSCLSCSLLHSDMISIFIWLGGSSRLLCPTWREKSSRLHVLFSWNLGKNFTSVVGLIWRYVEVLKGMIRIIPRFLLLCQLLKMLF